jgi:hypothetical protein
MESRDDILFDTLITDQEAEQAGRWVLDEFQGFQVYALFMDKDLLTERLANFQAGVSP